MDCSVCQGKGYIVKRVHGKVWDGEKYDQGWTLEREKCENCGGTGIHRVLL